MGWSYEEAEAYLASLEPLGWRLGLDRIRLLVSALGMPQHRFASVHVVGTNGKTSVAEMTMHLLEAHGVRAGAHVSPHADRWSERVLVAGAEIYPDAFAAAVERVAASVEAVDRKLPENDAVTQFEAATAAAFVALAAAGVEVGVIEAGLGGRLDATNVLPSRITALTSVGLEHTEWLGDTEERIAVEKLAVLRDHSTLVAGPVSTAVEELARRTAAERGARFVPVRGLAPSLRLASPGRYQRLNFAVALACADVILDSLDPERVAEVAAGLELRGRVELAGGEPDLVLDAAHNPGGARALAEALEEVASGRPVIACVAVLADKDAARFLAALAPAIAGLVATEIPADRLARAGRPGAKALPAEQLLAASAEAGIAPAELVADPSAAVERAIALARERDGVALVCGSHYLLRYASRA
ncbi:MAG TPA: cyanophycin synthetase [Solirubrobacterales bacterium]|nr:cyanophycin synthetase [Solirubrobacterales bacterium]